LHISTLSNTFAKDPHTVVKAWQIVKLEILKVDAKRTRIALTMRLTDAAGQSWSGQTCARNTESYARFSAEGWRKAGCVLEVEGVRSVC
jgi:transcriptional accessory protein Tex/SPT6